MAKENKNPVWNIIDEQHNDIQHTMDVPLDLAPPRKTGLILGTTVIVSLLVFGAFAFAPWSNPIQTFMGSVTEDTSFEELFGEPAPAEETEATGTGETSEADELSALFGDDTEEVPADEGEIDEDALAKLFGEEDTGDTRPAAPAEEDPSKELEALFGNGETTPEAPAATEGTRVVDVTPIRTEISTDYTTDAEPLATSRTDEIERLSAEPFAVEPIATTSTTPTLATTPLATTPTATAVPTVPTTAPVAATSPDSPFPINTHTVAFTIPIGGGAPVGVAAPSVTPTGVPAFPDALRTAAPAAVGAQPAFVDPRFISRQAPPTGPEHIVIALMILGCAIVGWALMKKQTSR